MNMNTEKDIIYAALHQFKLITGIDVNNIEFNLPRAKLTLEEVGFDIEVKRGVLKRNIGTIINQMNTLTETGEPLLVGDYINDRLGEKLQNADINYLDTVGNAYLNKKPLFILIKGNAKPKDLIEPIDQAFTPNGLKVIFTLLTYPELAVAGTQREIATRANVALGTVGVIIKNLIDKEFLRQKIRNNKRQWNKDKLPELIEKWAEEYPKLRKKQFLGRYIAHDHDWWGKHDLTKYGAQLGGEIAGGEYTGYLKPEIATVYIAPEKKNDFLKIFKLAKANDLNNTQGMLVEVLAPFWNIKEDIVRNQTLTDPLIAYADLIATADVRNIETAQMMRENHLEKLINRVSNEN
ncbi:MAG: hypothetical protein ACI8RW_000197 [Porticoccaceae bacterium]|jgi:hypothetical protein